MTRTFTTMMLVLCAACTADPITPLAPHEPTPRPADVVEPQPQEYGEPYNGTRPVADPHHRPSAQDVGNVGQQGRPDGEYRPIERECDGIDNDGDGRIDERLALPEAANAEDDDCDGVADEGTLGAECGADSPCVDGLTCDDGGQCSASCAEPHRRCVECWMFIELGDADMMEVECEHHCVDFWHACADIGGQCIRGECRRWPTLGCFGRGMERHDVVHVANGEQHSDAVEVCR